MPRPRKRPEDKLKVGRKPMEYNEQTGEIFCNRLEAGEGVHLICRSSGMPSWATICKWKRKSPEFATRYARARETSAESLENQAIEVAFTAHDSDSAQAARIQVDALKWAAAKRDPRRYSDKVDVNHSGSITLEALITKSFDPLTIEHIPGD